MKKKKPSKNSGKSKCGEYPFGVRKKSGGKELAPKSLRVLGKRFLSECSESELKKAEVFDFNKIEEEEE